MSKSLARNLTQPVVECDNEFLAILSTFATMIQDTASDAATHILDISADFLSSEASSALKKFHDLYFSQDRSLEDGKNEVNRDVDAMMDNVRRIIAEGGDISAAEIEEDSALKQVRLSLAGVQKELEAIIAIESGIRERLHPALMTMQFEDAMRQRLTHMVQAWGHIMKNLATHGKAEKDLLGPLIAALLTSNGERRSFYETVLHETPPLDSIADDPTFAGFFE